MITTIGARSDEVLFRGRHGRVRTAAHRRWSAAIGVRAVSASRCSRSQEFGWQFWQTDTWDPVAGEFGARPFIWGTLYSSILALVISTPIALGIAIFISELAPDWLRRPLVFLTELLAAIPSIVYGLWGIFVLVPFVRQLEVGDARLDAEHPALQLGRRSASACCRRPRSWRSWSFPSARRWRAKC